MILDYPEYLERFRCVGGSCPDTCCAGWEVDIDPETEEYYREVEGRFGERIRAEMKKGEEGAYFPLKPDGRCPFLNKENLCDLYSALGEESLCQVCTEYPRYYNGTGEYEQVDLSLSCMEVGRLFFEGKGPVRYIRKTDGDPEEDLRRNGRRFRHILTVRDRAIAILQGEEMPGGFAIRFREAGRLFGQPADFPGEPEEDILLKMRELEVLDDRWTGVLSAVCRAQEEDTLQALTRRFLAGNREEAEEWFTKLAAYFIFRYTLDAFGTGDLEEEWRFIRRSIRFLLWMCALRMDENGGNALSREDMIDIAHLYSRQVEHSLENVDALRKE